jgi:hypothetical protein
MPPRFLKSERVVLKWEQGASLKVWRVKGEEQHFVFNWLSLRLCVTLPCGTSGEKMMKKDS